MSQPRFLGKTYSRAKTKDSASQAFDDLFDDGTSKSAGATRAASVAQKWGKTKFTSVRDACTTNSPDNKKRKVQMSPSSDPFTFESSDEGGISPQKRVNILTAPSLNKKPTLPIKELFKHATTESVSNHNSEIKVSEEQFRPVKRFFRTHKGFIEKEKPEKIELKKNSTAPSKLRSVVNKKTTPDVPKEKSAKDQFGNSSQDSSTSGIFLSSSAKSDPDWLSGWSADSSRDHSPDSIFTRLATTSAQYTTSSTSSPSLSLASIPSSALVNKTNNNKPDLVSHINQLSPSKRTARERDNLFDALLDTSSSATWKRSQSSTSDNSKQNSQNSYKSSSNSEPNPMSDSLDSLTSPVTSPNTSNYKQTQLKFNPIVRETNSGGPESPMCISDEENNVSEMKVKSISLPVNNVKTSDKAEEVPSGKRTLSAPETLGDEFSFNDDDLIVIRGSSQSSQQSNNSLPESPLSQGARNKRTLLKSKHLSNSPKKSPAKFYNPRQWIQDGSPPELPCQRTVSLTSSQPLAQGQSQNTGNSHSFDFDEKSPMPLLTRQARVPQRKGVLATLTDPVMAVKVTREHKNLYTVVRNVKDVHECQEHGETLEFQDDIHYLLDGLNDTQTVTTRCLSTLSLANKCIEPVFRMHLRAHGTVARIFSALRDACNNPCLAMSTSLIMFMLSRDRLSIDVDQDGIEMMINLLNADNKYKKMKPGQQKDYNRIRLRVQEVIAQLKKDGGAKNMELSEISTSNLATETLLALSSRRSGDSFKEEMRSFGGLDHIVDIVTECTDGLDEDEIVDITDPLIDTLKRIDRCLRVLENVTYLNSDNQTYLISYSSSSLISSLCSLLKLTEKIMSLHPAPIPEPEPEPADDKEKTKAKVEKDKKASIPWHPSQLVFQCLLSILRVLLNITHDNVWGSQKVGQHEGLMSAALLSALHVPQFAPVEERFDLLVLSLGMMINLVEHCELNRRLLVKTDTVSYYDFVDQPTNHNSSDGQIEAIEALTQLFLQKETAAAHLEECVTLPQSNKPSDQQKPAIEGPPAAGNDSDKALVPKNADESGEWQESDSGLLWVIGKKKKRKANQNEDDDDDEDEQHIEIIPSTMEDEENFTKALHKAGKHMEDSIVAAYVALLIGCIIRENANLVEKVREHLPDGSFEPMVNILTKFLGFMNLTSGVAAHSSKSIAEIIQVMDKL